MPSIHVIYDPNDRISHRVDDVKRHGLTVAFVLLDDARDMTPEYINEITNNLTDLLLQHMVVPEEGK